MLCLDDGSFRCRADASYIFAHISFSIKGGEAFALLGRKVSASPRSSRVSWAFRS